MKRNYFSKEPRQRMKLSRQHWTKKDNRYKAKVPYIDEDEAYEFLETHPWLKARGYTVYQCEFCMKWHVGCLKQEEVSKS